VDCGKLAPTGDPANAFRKVTIEQTTVTFPSVGFGADEVGEVRAQGDAEPAAAS
jgi:hypothetical protein